MLGKFNPGSRTETIHLRATQEERQKISDAAQKTRRTMTNFVLSSTLSAADKVLAGVGEHEVLKSIVEPLPPSPNQLDAGAAKIVSVAAGLNSNLAQLIAHAERTGGVLAGLTGGKGPLMNLSAASFAAGLGAKTGGLKGAQAAALADALADPARQLNELAHRLNGGQKVDPSEWHPPVAGLVKVLLADT